MPARKRPTWPVHPVMVVITLAVCGFLLAAAVGYILHRNRNEQLGRAIAAKEVELRQLRLTNQLLDARIKFLRSQSAIERQVNRLQLPLKPTRHDQILVLADPVVALPVRPPSLELAGRPAGP